MAEKNTLGYRIACIRRGLGLKQHPFAYKIGINRAASISDYETDKRKPEIATLVKIAELGMVSLDWLLTGEGPKEKVCERSDKSEGVRTFAQMDQKYGGDGIKPGILAQDQAVYKTVDPEVIWLYNQVQRILKYGDIETVGKLKGFLAALDPGEKE